MSAALAVAAAPATASTWSVPPDLTGTATLVGTVTYGTTTTRVPGATVTLFEHIEGNWYQLKQTTTDASGNYQFKGIDSQQLRVILYPQPSFLLRGVRG